MTDTSPDQASTKFSCVTGHQVPAERLQELTEMQTLDQGAEVRVCREHGTPIAFSRDPREPGDD